MIAKTKIRKSVFNFVASKMILLKSERLVYKNVYPMRRRRIRGIPLYTRLRTIMKTGIGGIPKQNKESDA